MMSLRKLFVALACVCMSCLITVRATGAPDQPPALPQGPALVATVTAVEGLVQVRNDENADWRMAEVGMTFAIGGEARTGPKSKVVFTLPPKQTVTVDRMTTVKILEAARSSTSFHADLGMLYGRMRYDVEAGGLEHEAVIRTPSSALAVKGTIVVISDDALGSDVKLYHGRADLTMTNSRTVELSKGMDSKPSPTTQPTTEPVSPESYVRQLDPDASMGFVRVNSQYQTVAGYSYQSTATTTSQSGALSTQEQTVVAYNSKAGGLEAGLHVFNPTGGTTGGGVTSPPGGIVIPPPPNPVGDGKLTFSLTWTGDGSTGLGLPDLDFTVKSPTGKTYSPAVNPGNQGDVTVSPKGPVGPEVSAGVQTVYWSKNCPVGTYTYSVHYNGTGDPASFTVQVLLNDKQINPTYQGAVLTELDNHVDFSIAVPPTDQTAAAKAKAKLAAAKAGKPAVKPIAVVKNTLGKPTGR